MYEPFGVIFQRHLSSRGYSFREFSILAAGGKEESGGASYVSKVARGLRPPNWNRVLKWKEVLELQGSEAQEFLESAALAHVPAAFVEVIKELAGRLYDIEARVLRFTKAVEGYIELNQELSKENAQLHDDKIALLEEIKELTLRLGEYGGSD